MEPQQTVRDVWRHHITGLLDQALERNDATISDIAGAITTTILAGRHVYAFGAGHSLALVNEMYRRAGGMKIVRPVWNEELLSRADPEAAGKLENQAGYYARLTDGLDWGPGDLCWVISNSGRNPLVIELAQEARRHGVTVVGLVSAEHSGTVSAAAGLPKLPEIADYLLDNAGVFGDAALDITGLAERMAPTSTIIGAALIHATWAEVAERLVARGHIPEVWGSANRGQAPRLIALNAGPRGIDRGENQLTVMGGSVMVEMSGPWAGARCGCCPAGACPIGAGRRALSPAPRSPAPARP